MSKDQAGFATIWAIVIAAVVLIGGGAAAYVATDGFGMNKDDEQAQQDTTSTESSHKGHEDHANKDQEDSDAAKLPDWYASEFPVHSDAKLSSVTDATGGMDGYIVAYTFGSTPEGTEVVQWYRDQFSKDGWTISETGDATKRFHAKKANGHQAVVNINAMKSVTIVTVTAFNKM